MVRSYIILHEDGYPCPFTVLICQNLISVFHCLAHFRLDINKERNQFVVKHVCLRMRIRHFHIFYDNCLQEVYSAHRFI